MISQVQKKHAYQQGFTLLEMIAVIVILAIVAVLGARFVTESSRTYQAVQARSVLINTGRQAVESMSRQLRVSLSYSVRITNGNTCLEFMPIVGGGYYLNPVPDAANGAPAASIIAVSPHTVDLGLAQYVSIGAAASSEIYGVGAVSVAALASRLPRQLTLSANKSWQRNSLGQHFFLLDAPQAFCVVGTELRLYPGQDILLGAVDLGTSHSLLATNVTSPAPFSISAGSENRNAVISFNITFAYSLSGETIALNQSVMLRNVP